MTETLPPAYPIFMEPGPTPVKARALVKRIWEAAHQEGPQEVMLANLSLLAGIACAYLQDYAKLMELQTRPEDLAGKAPAEPAGQDQDLETRARQRYNDYINNHPTIHTNRFPGWSELTRDAKKEWLDGSDPK